ncbi:uncharacterized protein [Euphorbia lathyris]|uniref:uncharacterized protein isoform X3 n=1 Tax=Euphorbia lathyris TaxID=212925 RepID=UPI00331443B2
MAYALGIDEICQIRLLKAARFGNLDCLKRLADVLDSGDGLRQTLESIEDKDGRTAFHHAAIGGNTRVCRYLLEEVKVDHINLRDEALGETPLHQAIMAGHYNLAVYFLEKGAKPNVANDVGDTPLHYAVMKGYEKLLHLLISKGAEVDAKSDSSTSLVWAASFGNVKAMKILLDNNANPNMIHLPAPSPLIESILSGSFECVKLLLQCGLKPIELAALKVYDDVVMMLLPLTSPFSDWSYDGIRNYLLSDEPLKQREKNRNEAFLQLKSKGEDEFKRQEYIKAIYWYSECFFIKMDATIMSNLSFCWARLNNGDKALDSAQTCVALRPDWPKAHYREGVAWNLLEQFNLAAASFMRGLKLDPQNKELRAAYREALVSMYEQAHDDMNDLAL